MAYQSKEELATILKTSEDKYVEASKSGYEGSPYEWMAENAFHNGYVRLHFPLGQIVFIIVDDENSESGYSIMEVEFEIELEPYVGNSVFATAEECVERLNTVMKSVMKSDKEVESSQEEATEIISDEEVVDSE